MSSAAEVSRQNKALIIYNEGSLTFANQEVSRIPDVVWKLYSSKTYRLDLSYNFIITLQSLEKFTNLTELILDRNCISERTDFPIMPSLKILSLNNNRIHDLEEFIQKVSISFPNLTFLSLLGNKACRHKVVDPEYDDDDYQRYRYFVLHFLPNLKYLDSTRVNSREREVAAAKGHFSHIRRPRTLTAAESRNIGSETIDLIPDNLNFSPPVKHRGSYIQGEYRFINKESEGNRFILNQDL